MMETKIWHMIIKGKKMNINKKTSLVENISHLFHTCLTAINIIYTCKQILFVVVLTLC